MGCGASTPEEAISRQIDQEIRKQGPDIIPKVLLLGSGESGKSTIFKQMKILSLDNEFSEEELNGFKVAVYGNCVSQMKVLCLASERLGIHVQAEEARKFITDIQHVKHDTWSVNVADAVAQLWQDSGIQETYSMRDEKYQLNDTAAHFFDNVERFKDPEFIPIVQDVLLARIRSAGIEEAVFAFNDCKIRVVDVGGQRSERRKWIHCFDDVTAVLFVAAASEYNQFLREDAEVNRMKESLSLFDQTVNNNFFENTTFILFLNKMDIFAEKLQGTKDGRKMVPLSDYFPDYNGGDNIEKAKTYIREKYEALSKAKKQIYVHFTVAIEAANMENAIADVNKIISSQAINDAFVM